MERVIRSTGTTVYVVEGAYGDYSRQTHCIMATKADADEYCKSLNEDLPTPIDDLVSYAVSAWSVTRLWREGEDETQASQE